MNEDVLMRPCYMDKVSGTVVDISQLHDDTYYINRIKTPVPFYGRGHASRLMKQVLADADAEGVALVLEINPYGGLSYSQLAAWYGRMGFKKINRTVYERKPGLQEKRS